jgi:uncharacterized membrane protein (UPF0127 family)
MPAAAVTTKERCTMAIQDILKAPVRVEATAKNLTVVQVAPGATIPPHRHDQGYVVLPFLPASLERLTHHNGAIIKREPLTLLPFVPYYVDATEAGHTISVKNNGSGFSCFQKIVREPPITGPQRELPTEDITIVSDKDYRHHFKVEMATTLIEQAVGLMFRPHLAHDRGMLFVWKTPREVAMYMRNTRFALDILFIDENLKISNIHQNAAPGDLTPIHSDGNVILTLEIPGGTVAKLGIDKGDTLC